MQLLSFKHYLFNLQPHYIDCRIAVIFTLDSSLIEPSLRNCAWCSQHGKHFVLHTHPLPSQTQVRAADIPKHHLQASPHLPLLVTFGELIHSYRQYKAPCTKERQMPKGLVDLLPPLRPCTPERQNAELSAHVVLDPPPRDAAEAARRVPTPPCPLQTKYKGGISQHLNVSRV